MLRGFRYFSILEKTLWQEYGWQNGQGQGRGTGSDWAEMGWQAI